MLDHMLVPRGLMGHFQTLEIDNEGLADELAGYAAVRHGPASDHAPMVATFVLKLVKSQGFKAADWRGARTGRQRPASRTQCGG